MAIDKQHILDEIKRVAKANGGKAPGRQKFTSETGIKESDWYPQHWLRWSDALRESGLSPNEMETAWSDDVLLEKCIGLIRELKHIPVVGELRRKSKKDPDFLSDTAFRRLGGKSKLLTAIIRYCEQRVGYDDIIEACTRVANENQRSLRDDRESSVQEVVGFVYLMKSGRHHKIGKTNAVGRRERELAIQLPEKANTVHVIKTDDPTGIEAYWHKRFESKRGNGEWFDLTSGDIKAFKRRKFM
jgi:hypothetical protein